MKEGYNISKKEQYIIVKFDNGYIGCEEYFYWIVPSKVHNSILSSILNEELEEYALNSIPIGVCDCEETYEDDYAEYRDECTYTIYTAEEKEIEKYWGMWELL